MRLVLFLVILLVVATPVAAQRQSLGIYNQWGAFREKERCFALSEPERAPRNSSLKPFASVGFWARRGVRSQVHFRLSSRKRPSSAVLLRIDDRTFQLVASGADAWASDLRADAEIVAAMRTGIDMTIETRSERGALVRNYYQLRGAATAIDAAAIGCARPLR
jgi:hypothetical protein